MRYSISAIEAIAEIEKELEQNLQISELGHSRRALTFCFQGAAAAMRIAPGNANSAVHFSPKC